MGWILVMFDLPTDTKENRKMAMKFRNALLDDGYTMMQFSAYMRACSSYDRMQKHANRLQPIIPQNGNVRVIFITDKQWEKSLLVISKSYGEKVAPTNQLSLSEFW